MAVGIPITKGYIDNRIGQLILDMRRTFNGIDTFWEFLSENTDAQIMNRLNYTAEEVELLRNAVGALAKLSRVARGQDTVPVADNFFFHAKKLTALE